MELYLLILVLSFTSLLRPSSSSPNTNYDTCTKTFQCGTIQNIGYPFYDGSTRPEFCGYPGFKLDCDTTLQSPQITISSQAYNLLSVSDDYRINISRTDTWQGNCPTSLVNTTIDFSKFNFSSSDQNITFFYNCKPSSSQSALLSQSLSPTSANCIIDGTLTGYYLTQAMIDHYIEDLNMFEICSSNLVLPALKSQVDAVSANPSPGALLNAFSSGFELGLIAETDTCGSCKLSGGECGYNSDSNKFTCHCSDKDYDLRCGDDSSPPQGLKKRIPLIIASSAGIGIVILGLLILFSCYVLGKCKPIPKNQQVEDLLKNYESLVPRRYTYTNIVKMTDSFREKLGEGGYGTVFKGKLQDGRVVGVKVWKQSKGDGHEFVNEVLSICSTSHINVVPLVGFCFEGLKGALVYEFMPNGSLEKFIRGREGNKNDQALSFAKLFEIAVGIARGLEYLHRDCNTKIVHFDIKPHNILLDEDFTPKISDFGLAKAFKQKDSIISISGARGTAGYIAPEVFFSSFGGVSHKSDVYSYGMMLLEMVGCTKRKDENVENSSELYFPRWIYKQLEQKTALDCAGRSLNDEDKEVERKMVLVGLWCIQTNPWSRPSMCRVLGMLEGEVELEVPPMPSLSSPPIQQQPTDDGSGSFLSSTTYAHSNNLEISTYKFSM